jgi:hypothetical protein
MISTVKTYAVGELLTVAETAEILKRKPQTIRRNIEHFKHCEIGGDYLIFALDLLDKIQKGKICKFGPVEFIFPQGNIPRERG